MGGTRKEWVAVIRPTQDCLRELPRLFAPGDVQRIAKELQKGYPVLEPVAAKADTNNIVIMERTVRDSTTLHARHRLLIISKNRGIVLIRLTTERNICFRRAGADL